MKSWIGPNQLWILNLVLDHDPILREALFQTIMKVTEEVDGLAAGLVDAHELEIEHVQKEVTEARNQSEDLVKRIHEWFKTHPGKHPLSSVRKDLGVDANSKPFKTAIWKLLNAKTIASSGKRGLGAEYWLRG